MSIFPEEVFDQYKEKRIDVRLLEYTNDNTGLTIYSSLAAHRNEYIDNTSIILNYRKVDRAIILSLIDSTLNFKLEKLKKNIIDNTSKKEIDSELIEYHLNRIYSIVRCITLDVWNYDLSQYFIPAINYLDDGTIDINWRKNKKSILLNISENKDELIIFNFINMEKTTLIKNKGYDTEENVKNWVIFWLKTHFT